jgi:hypothetical protein
MLSFKRRELFVQEVMCSKKKTAYMNLNSRQATLSILKSKKMLVPFFISSRIDPLSC